MFLVKHRETRILYTKCSTQQVFLWRFPIIQASIWDSPGIVLETSVVQAKRKRVELGSKIRTQFFISLHILNSLCAHKKYGRNDLRKRERRRLRAYNTFLTPQRVVGKVLVFELNV